jgi:ferric-dicitrate binding protein FerR (iron transport regulator)
MNDPTNERLIRKYLDGLSTEDENRALYEWLSESEANLLEFKELKRDHDRIGIATAGAGSPQQARRRTELKIAARRRRRRIGRAVASSAAAVVLALLFAIGPTDRDDPRAEEVAFLTRRGEQKGITLPDGSVVTLNAERRLSYIFDEARNLRLVLLTGEAFFDVVRDTLNPFIVRTDHVNARVLGTKFNICDYPEDMTVETTIMEGRVALSLAGSDEAPIEVTANDRATLVKGSGSLRLDRLDPSSIAQWMNGALVFREALLGDIAGRLERHYDVSVTLADPRLREMVYTATFDRDTPIADILELLSYTSPVEYTIAGSRIEIKLKTVGTTGFDLQ